MISRVFCHIWKRSRVLVDRIAKWKSNDLWISAHNLMIHLRIIYPLQQVDDHGFRKKKSGRLISHAARVADPIHNDDLKSLSMCNFQLSNFARVFFVHCPLTYNHFLLRFAPSQSFPIGQAVLAVEPPQGRKSTPGWRNPNRKNSKLIR